MKWHTSINKTRVDELTSDKNSLDDQIFNEQKVSSSLLLLLALEALNTELAKLHEKAHNQANRYESMMSALQAENNRLEEQLEATTAANKKELFGLQDSHNNTVAKNLRLHKDMLE